MAWTMEQEAGDESQGNGQWTMVDEPEPGDSLLRSGGVLADSFVGGATATMADQLLGGQGHFKELRKGQSQLYNNYASMLRDQGLSDEDIVEQIGSPPMTSDSADEALTKATGMDPRTERERVLSESGKAAGEFLAFDAMIPGASSAAGMAKSAGVGGLFGLGSGTAKEEGQGAGGQFLQGLMLAAAPAMIMKSKAGLAKAIEFGKGLLSKEGASKAAKGTAKFLEEVGTPKAMAEVELAQRDLVGRVAKTSDEMIAKSDKMIEKLAEPTMKDAGTFKARNIEKEIVKANQGVLLDTISGAPATNKRAWEGVNAVVEENFEASRAAYKKMYKGVEEGSAKLKVKPTSTMEFSKGLSKEMKSSLLATSAESGVKGPVDTLIKKLLPDQSKSAKALVDDLKAAGIHSDYESVLSMMKRLAMKEGAVREIPVPQLMATKRSLSRILSKSDIVPAPVDLLGPLAGALKKDIYKGLEASEPLKKMYEGAEALFGKTQDVFNNATMLKARKSANPEELAAFFSKPSNIQKLKEATVGRPVNDLIDRMVVENIASKSRKEASEMAKEMREFMGSKANEAMDKILEYGDKMASPGSTSISRAKMLEELQTFDSVGTKPKYTLDLMKTSSGRQLVNNSLKRSPNGQKKLKELHKMTMQDLMSSVTKDGAIDFEKARDILADPEIRTLVKEAVGPEGLKFMEKLQTYGKNMSENLRLFKAKEPGFFKNLIDNYTNKTIMGVLYSVGAIVGGPKGLLFPAAIEGVKQLKKVRLQRILQDKPARDALKALGKKGLSPKQTRDALKRFAQVGGSVLGEDEE